MPGGRSEGGRAAFASCAQPCVRTRGCACRLLHAHTAELVSESLRCLIAAAHEVGVVLHARTSPVPLPEKAFSGNRFLPKALFVLPVSGDTEREGRCSARLSERILKRWFPKDFAKCCSSR